MGLPRYQWKAHVLFFPSATRDLLSWAVSVQNINFFVSWQIFLCYFSVLLSTSGLCGCCSRPILELGDEIKVSYTVSHSIQRSLFPATVCSAHESYPIENFKGIPPIKCLWSAEWSAVTGVTLFDKCTFVSVTVSWLLFVSHADVCRLP